MTRLRPVLTAIHRLAAGMMLACTLSTLAAETYDDVILAGSPGQAGYRDGRGTEARLLYSSSGTLDARGNLYVAEAGAIRRISPAGEVTTVAGDPSSAMSYGYRDGHGRDARFSSYQFPIAADAQGNVYAADPFVHTIRRITPAGEVTTLAGVAGALGYVDGRGAAARFSEPSGIAVDREGRIYVSDAGNRVIRRITPAGDVTTFAGQIDPRTQLRAFARPDTLAFDGRGVLYVADEDVRTDRHTLSLVSPEGLVTASRWGLFGNSTIYSEEGGPLSYKVDREGNLLVHRDNQNWISRLTPDGVETSQLHPAASPASGQLGSSLGLLAVDSAGAVYLHDRYAIRKRTPVAAAGSVPTWSEVTLLADFGLSGVTYANGVYVLAGSSDFYPTDVEPLLYSSPDGVSWIRRHAPAIGAAFPPRFAGGRFFVAVRGSQKFPGGSIEGAGDTVILSSVDGASWTSSSFITRGNVPVDAPREFAYGNGLFVAASPSVTNPEVNVLTSADGVTWIPRPIAGGAAPVRLASVTYFKGFFYLALWPRQLLRSSDGIEWTEVATAPVRARYVAASAEALLLVAEGGSPAGLWRSTDGEFFAPVSPDDGRISGRIQFQDGAFVTAESEPEGTLQATSVAIRASHDGQTWTTVGRIPTRDAWSLDVARGDGRYAVIAGLRVYTGVTELAPGGVVTRSGQLGNVSIRARAGPGPGALIVGLTLAGKTTPGTTSLLVRGIAPALGQFGVTGTLVDPQLRWMNQSTVIAANNDWNGAADIARAASVVGAFPLANDSKDSALLLPEVSPGIYTLHVTGHDDRNGLALAEVYDLPPRDTTVAAELRNFSARVPVLTGSEILIAGFEVRHGELRVLLRAIGPGLEQFGIPSFLGNPQLAVHRGSTLVAYNDDWTAAGTPSGMLGQVGAFALEPGSTDAAVIATLPPGTYTVQVSGVGGSAGGALFEAFVLP